VINCIALPTHESPFVTLVLVNLLCQAEARDRPSEGAAQTTKQMKDDLAARWLHTRTTKRLSPPVQVGILPFHHTK
jgi:hypothetical protein